jgi:hypothetical protein
MAQGEANAAFGLSTQETTVTTHAGNILQGLAEHDCMLSPGVNSTPRHQTTSGTVTHAVSQWAMGDNGWTILVIE